MKMTRLASLRRSFPTVRLIVAPFRWIGKSRRRIWCVVLILLAMVAAPALWWATQLWGLPDIGDPFDVVAFWASTIPDDRNAYVLYRQAETVLEPWEPYRKTAGNKVNMLASWSKAVPELRRWAEENREALALFRQGTERPDALDSLLVAQDGLGETWRRYNNLYSLQVLALLEGSRLEEQGDMAGAWGWYRAVLRAIRHIGMHATIFRRHLIQRWDGDLRSRLITWSADPRITPAVLRQALDDVIACESLAPSEIYSLKAEYVGVDSMLDGPDNMGRHIPPRWLINLASSKAARPIVPFLNPELMRSVNNAWRFWRREPERSRRVIRLVVANWLAYYELPPGKRPDSDPNPKLSYDLYPFGPEAPAKARILSPEVLDRWLTSAHDALAMFHISELNGARTHEWANHREVLILLGTALYRRDHGTDPPTPESLVGPYLKSLPAELPDDGRNEATPRAGKTVE
jgi:hypothetical protein